VGQSMSALPSISDINLFRYGESVVDLDPEVADGAFHSRVPEQELHGAGAAAQAIRPHNLRRTAILRYASWAAVVPISWVVRLPFDSGPFDQSRERRDGPIGDIKRVLFTTTLEKAVLAFGLNGGYSPASQTPDRIRAACRP
jgi:hypothetical protein